MPNTVCGEFPKVARREHTPFKVGKDASKYHQQNYRINSVVDFFLADIKDGVKVDGRKLELTSDQFAFYSNIEQVLEDNSDLIESHVDRRIQLFFMQLICSYKMPYHFEWVEAQDEYGKGSNYKLKDPRSPQTKVFQTEAAHPSTMPSLMAYPKDEWNEYKAGQRRNKPKGFVYLKYGHSYLQHNSTLELARCVNRADCLIDGTHSDSRLRNAAIKIINAVSDGKYGPRKGMKRFMVLMEKFVEKAHEKLNADDPRAIVLEQYLDRIQDVAPMMEADEGYFDQLLGVKVDDHDRENVLREVVYKKRFSLIQGVEAIESRISRAILRAQNKMLNKRNKSIKSVDYRLRYVLLEAVNPQFKRTLERLFCTSLDQLQTGVEKNEERLRAFEGRTRIRSFRAKHSPEIAKLKRVLRRLFREMDSAELDYRSGLFKDLRVTLNDWTQPDFTKKYKEKHPNQSMYQSKVSRFEQRVRPSSDREYVSPLNQRRKDIGETEALRVADTHGVDAGLFLPAIVSSIY